MKRLLQVVLAGGGGWMYRAGYAYDDGRMKRWDSWQFGPRTREEAIAQGQERFGSDYVPVDGFECDIAGKWQGGAA